MAVSEADKDSLAARLATDVVHIGPASPAQSYLRVEQIVAGALLTDCDAVHPGYGFLSERAELAEACAANGLIFVGPTGDTIRRGGDKIEARRVARAAGVPTGAGSDAVSGADAALTVADDVGYPILLKAAAGGGGRGMVRVDSARSSWQRRFGTASSEAEAAFGDGRMYVERYVENARHVEVQLLGDHHGRIVHLGDRDCSTQRRFQKLVEEAPAAVLSADLRQRIADAAVAIGHELDYRGAGTVEFLVDLDRDEFSFLEINTRVQVEHPVTEMVTGVDIVREQLRIAAGEPLSFDQDDVAISGHAIECRINAESVADGFLPSPGHAHPLGSTERRPRPRRQPRLRRLRDPAVLRLADRQADRDRRRSGRGDPPDAERACRLRDRGRRHDPRPSAGGVVARRLPKRHDQHPLARDDPPPPAPAHRDCTHPDCNHTD